MTMTIVVVPTDDWNDEKERNKEETIFAQRNLFGIEIIVKTSTYDTRNVENLNKKKNARFFHDQVGLFQLSQSSPF